ncbi:MAG: hypothetical protein IKU85_10780 [Bacteroidaceae bacterium]|nr:hypothetical protein [Bacteroidaceae bacterium]
MSELYDFLEEIIIPLSMCVAMPVMIVWIIFRKKTNDTNRRTEILLAAIEKNPDIDMEEFIRKMNPHNLTIKEKLLRRLLYGSILSTIGICFMGTALWMDYKGGMSTNDLMGLYLCGSFFFFVGLSIIAVFFISKRMLAKEIEVEEKKTIEK